MDTHSLSELGSIMKLSELHALKYNIDQGITSSLYEKQIETGFLTISATSKMIKKAVKLFEVFLRRMYKDGFSLALDCTEHYHCPASALVVEGAMIPVRVKEKHAVKMQIDRYGPYKTLIPSGNLVIEIYGGAYGNLSKTLAKPDDGEWEDVIERVIPYLRKTASRIREERLRHEEWVREREEAERIRKEHEKKIKDRAAIVKSVLNDAWLYERAEVIRKYCDFAEQVVDSEEYMEELEIARQVADWIDPTTDYEDELLSEEYSPEDFLKKA